jgi:hypothetical protein
VPKFFPGAKNQYCEILASLNYNDGAFGVVPGLSHSTATLATGLQALNATFVISLNQQWSYQRSVNPTNDFWTTLSFLKEL